MDTSRTPPDPRPNDQSAREEPVDLAALSKETGVPIDTLRTFAKISDPKNRHVFTAAAAQKAFSGVKA